MELKDSKEGAVTVVAVSGRIDQGSAQAFQQGLQPHLDACSAAGAPVLLDFAGVDYISSVGLRVLMLASRQAKSQQGRIAIAALTPSVAEVFQISRFNLVLTVCPDRASGLAALA